LWSLVNLRELYRLDAVVNENKNIVIELLQHILATDKTICRCEHCILDIIAITLNDLPPRYRVGLIGTIDFDVDAETQYLEKVQDGLYHAIMRVTENPHHLITLNQKKY